MNSGIVKILSILGLSFSAKHISAQSADSFKFISLSDTAVNWLIKCPFTVDSAIRDIQENNLKIVIHGGFTGFGNINEKKADNFAKKYNLTFYYLGCFRIWSPEKEDTYGYNDKIWEYLIQKHGTIVKKEYEAIWK